MSTRYVWEQCRKQFNINHENIGITNNTIKTIVFSNVRATSRLFYQPEISFEKDVYVCLAQDRKINNNGTFSLTNIYKTEHYIGGNYTAAALGYIAAVLTNHASSPKPTSNSLYAAISLSPISETTQFDFVFPYTGNFQTMSDWAVSVHLLDKSGYLGVEPYYKGPANNIVYKDTLVLGKGSRLGYISGPSNATYPQDGVSGNYWYTYAGSDNIDPASVSYPSSPKSGTPITIAVNAGAGNTYGGTISYQYEVSLDGGNSWAQLGLTTARSMDYTIPKGSPTFRARVQARDDMGFTSSTWIYGPQVNVINNSAPGIPGSITVPVSPRGGAQTTITWTAAGDPDGNLAGYQLERQLDGGGWTSLLQENKLSFVDTIPKGSNTVAYRVRAYDTDNAYGDYRISDTRTVVNNNPPRITCSLSGDLGTKETGFVVEYSVADDEGGAVTVTEQVGELVKRSYQVTLGQTNQYQVTGEHFMRILNGAHTLKITARDAGGLTDSVTLTFTKAVYAASVTLEQPLAVEKPITLAIMSVLGQIPAGHTYKVEATNNAKDAAPVWQDVTNEVKKGVNIVFQNKTQANGPAFNFRLNVARGSSGAPGYLQAITGGFQ